MFLSSGISEKDQLMIFRILCGILYSGNVIFDEKDGGDASTVPVSCQSSYLG
jgi:myosin heavy subunit